MKGDVALAVTKNWQIGNEEKVIREREKRKGLVSSSKRMKKDEDCEKKKNQRSR